MCPDQKWFHDLIEKESGSVLLGNNKSCKVMRIGNIHLKLVYGCLRTIESVRYVPELKRNLISVGMLDSEGLNVEIEKESDESLKGGHSCHERNKNEWFIHS